MNTQEPKFRYGTRKAIDSLVKKFDLPHEDWMQDYPYEVADTEQVDFYLDCYDKLIDKDEKFVMMEFLIQATNDNTTFDMYHYWKKVKKHLINNFSIHQYTVYYWSCFDNKDIEDCFHITAYMRELWHTQTYADRKQINSIKKSTIQV